MAQIDLMTYAFKDQTLYRTTKIIGWFSLILALLRLIFFFFGFNFFPISLFRIFHFAAPMFTKMENDLVRWGISLTLVRIFFFIWILLQIMAGGLVLFGVMKKQKHAFWLYLVQTPLEFIAYIGFFIFFMFAIVYVVSGGKQTTGKVELRGENLWLFPFLFIYMFIINLYPFALVFIVRMYKLLSSENSNSSAEV